MDEDATESRTFAGATVSLNARSRIITRRPLRGNPIERVAFTPDEWEWFIALMQVYAPHEELQADIEALKLTVRVYAQMIAVRDLTDRQFKLLVRGRQLAASAMERGVL